MKAPPDPVRETAPALIPGPTSCAQLNATTGHDRTPDHRYRAFVAEVAS